MFCVWPFAYLAILLVHLVVWLKCPTLCPKNLVPIQLNCNPKYVFVEKGIATGLGFLCTSRKYVDTKHINEMYTGNVFFSTKISDLQHPAIPFIQKNMFQYNMTIT